MNAASLVDFIVTVNRSTRKIVITSTVVFSLLSNTGPTAGANAYTVLGFSTAVDKTGLMSYQGDFSIGFVYNTQFFLQGYKDPSTNRKAIDGVVNRSASGVTEVIKFGNERFMECDVNFITDLIQQQGSIVRTNESGVASFISLMEWLTDKAPVEFMFNENKPDLFQEFELESTPQSSNGLDYDLTELYDRGLSDYFNSGRLKFKLI